MILSKLGILYIYIYNGEAYLVLGKKAPAPDR